MRRAYPRLHPCVLRRPFSDAPFDTHASLPACSHGLVVLLDTDIMDDMSTMPIIFGSVFAVFFVGIVGCGCWRKWKEGGNNYALMPAQPVVGAYQSQHSPVYPYSQGAASPQPALSGAVSVA